MIYICKGCGQVCAAPCKICDGCCKAISDCFGPILQKPLGHYVVGTWIALLFVATPLGVLGVLSGGCNDVKITSIILIGLAVMHSFMAYYTQMRIHQNVCKSGSAFSGQAVAKEASKLMMYDIGFCIYVFVFVGSWGYACFALSTGCDVGTDDKAMMTFLSALVLIIWGVCAVQYAICWYFGNCCFGGMKMYGSGPYAGTGPPPVQGTAVGYPQR
mmetsp:Transcript_121880/g.235091  ORF Transcript_121880/g.235091 Transcript_121880/m.235091 type:complete len:215 (-) Transcript_121880:13-657(-)